MVSETPVYQPEQAGFPPSPLRPHRRAETPVSEPLTPPMHFGQAETPIETREGTQPPVNATALLAPSLSPPSRSFDLSLTGRVLVHPDVADAVEHVIKQLCVEDIVADAAIRCREASDPRVVERYATRFGEGQAMGELVAFAEDIEQGPFYLSDGFYRFDAAKRANMPVLWVRVYAGGRDAAARYAAAANVPLDRPRRPADTRRAVLNVLRDGELVQWSNSQIARWCKTNDKLVAKLRRERTGVGLDKSSPTRKYANRHGGTTVRKASTTRGRAPQVQRFPKPDPRWKPQQLADFCLRGTVLLGQALPDNIDWMSKAESKLSTALNREIVEKLERWVKTLRCLVAEH